MLGFPERPPAFTIVLFLFVVVIIIFGLSDLGTVGFPTPDSDEPRPVLHFLAYVLLGDASLAELDVAPSALKKRNCRLALNDPGSDGIVHSPLRVAPGGTEARDALCSGDEMRELVLGKRGFVGGQRSTPLCEGNDGSFGLALRLLVFAICLLVCLSAPGLSLLPPCVFGG